MHKITSSELSPNLARQKFIELADKNPKMFKYDEDRNPPKIFYKNNLISFPACAEVHISPEEKGSNVILRLMWGPLPAPFSRAVALTLAVIAGLILYSSIAKNHFEMIDVCLSLVLVVIPCGMLFFQSQGEKIIQNSLSKYLKNSEWTDHNH